MSDMACKGRKASKFKRAMRNVANMKGKGSPGKSPDGKLPPWLSRR